MADTIQAHFLRCIGKGLYNEANSLLEGHNQIMRVLGGKVVHLRPIMGTLACTLNNLRTSGRGDEAAKLLAAHNAIRSAFGGLPYDETADWTTEPMEGGFAIDARPPELRRDTKGIWL